MAETWLVTGGTGQLGLALQRLSLSGVQIVAPGRGLKVPQVVEPISTAQYPTGARHPMDSRLDTQALKRDFGVELRPWQDAVAEVVAELAVQRRTG